VFTGDARWLQIAVRPGASSDPCDFATLSLRQEVTPAPYAMQNRGIFVDDALNERGDWNTESGGQAAC